MAGPSDGVYIESNASLPGEPVMCILGGLNLQERHASAALVCRRWRHLANSSPQLLRVVDAKFGGGNERAVVRLNSFCAWLLAHAAQHVQRLSLDVHPAACDAPVGTSERVAAALATALAGRGMAGSLTALRLEASTAQPFVWLHGLRSLRHLVLIPFKHERVPWDQQASALPALEGLTLVGWPVELPPHARFPPFLTKLHLRYLELDTLPSQVSALSRLHTLSLRWASCTGSGYDMLAGLPSLRRFELRDCECWPSCLSQLTGLQALALDNSEAVMGQGEHRAQIVRDALPKLTRLTFLALSDTPGMEGPPAELASLTSLRSFYWLGASGPLPAGPWLTHLQRLAAMGNTIACSAAALAAAAQLKFLSVACFELPPSRVWSAALCAPALRRLICWASKEAICSSVQSFLHAQHRHPSLLLECKVMGGQNEFFACCGHDPYAATSLDAFLAGNA